MREQADRSPYALKPLGHECGETTKWGWSCVLSPKHRGECSGYPCPMTKCKRQAGHGREGLECLKEKRKATKGRRGEG